MSYVICFLSWNHEKWDWEPRPSDRVWGYLRFIGDQSLWYSFWGWRSGKLKFKRYTDLWTLDDLQVKRICNGYDSVPVHQIGLLLPGFTANLEKQFAIAKLFENFHGERKPEA